MDLLCQFYLYRLFKQRNGFADELTKWVAD